MSDVQNPLIPAGTDIAWAVVCILAIALAVVALVSLARAAKNLTALQRLVWTIIVLFVPILGASVWLGIGRQARKSPQDA